ncbi:hypothetical protein B0A52_01235 [Exophiala mesophila]|uniref:ZZ-type domain-containing protein n=1 Tax=Exophiala mesophila TaxID=212818 RepID=A0A438NGV1_EXOME|nr:hypothetical protein B0A52_01235 [Exophiala mesophila]
MASSHPHTGPVGPDTLITVKVIIDGTNRRFKLALRDLGANTLPQKLRFLLSIPPEQEVRFDRFSDSAGTYITLDSNNPAIYKQLYRAAKAKLKLRLKATVVKSPKMEKDVEKVVPAAAPSPKGFDTASSTAAASNDARQTFLETVLSQPSENTNGTPFQVFQKTCSYSPRCSIPGAFEQPSLVEGIANQAIEARSELQSLPVLPCLPALPVAADFPMTTYSIDCNFCGKHVPSEHYHCSICENGDFDLCKACIIDGVTCDGDDHWLIKRTIHNGVVIPSTTETLPPKKTVKAEPDDSEEPATPLGPENCEEDERTCNCCIGLFPCRDLVNCEDCADFDLCLICFTNGDHGHDPSHTFNEAVKYSLDSGVRALCAPGRGVRHEAVCDGCDKAIIGVRHKCLTCPDFDFCNDCIGDASWKHPGHRFAPLYIPIPVLREAKEVHRGIYCDGPLCKSDRRYITGDRYKCAICHDTDFCAKCEAWPYNTHNATHPLIKIKTALRHVQITTQQETDGDQGITQLGDKPEAKHAATETVRSPSTNAATQVQTVAEVKPAETTPAPADETVAQPALTPSLKDLQAWYVSDSTPDGTKVEANHLVSQTWVLRNPGPEAWPAGCAVHYIGGDDMRNLDNLHPSSVSNMISASRSNVLSTSLEPGKTAHFTVLVKSPSRKGRFISYWRLKTPGEIPFGHKLWVDIVVDTAPVEKPVSVPVDLPIRTPLLPNGHGAQHEDDKSEASSSTMIFPKLDKESPVSSTHNVSEQVTEEAHVDVVEPEASAETVDSFEDVESLELDETDSENQGFLTDEEYDILDGSDDDFYAAAEEKTRKE